jgi:hypothetical protein
MRGLTHGDRWWVLLRSGAGESLLDQGAKRDPCLVYLRETIPFLKWLGVEASGEEQADCISDQLAICVRALPKEGRLSTFFNPSKIDFRSISHQIGATKHSVIFLEHGQSRLAEDHSQLIKNINHTHACTPILNGRVV